MATIADLMRPGAPSTPSGEEKGEPPIVAEPRLDRSAFLYFGPRKGIDGQNYFSQCGACQHFVPENAMRGALSGARCMLFGSQFSITDDDSCVMFAPWATGDADGDCLAEHAEALVGGLPMAVQPYSVGYVRDTGVQCRRCRQFEPGENECGLYEALNAALPSVWALDEKVESFACCSAWTPMPPPPTIG